MAEHEPLRFVTGLSGKLAARERHVCVLLGAGVSRACGLPDVAQLQERVVEALIPAQRAAVSKLLAGRNIEEVLSRLRRIAALITGEQTVDGLTATQANELDAAVCQAIVKALDIQGADLAPVHHFAAWAARADYRLPVELFTVNYDLLLETALEDARVPYFDGFVGNLKARFHAELVEATPTGDQPSVPSFFLRLWKLHGSVNWAWQDDRQILRLGQAVTEGRAAAIYPSDAKYEESRRVPFVVLQDRLRRALHQPETLMLVAGYSFSDDHLNEMLFDAAAHRERSEFVVFCHKAIVPSLASRAAMIPNLQVVTGNEAILGGVRANWRQPDETPPGVWEDGQFALRDFHCLAAFLARSSTTEHEGDLKSQQPPKQTNG